MLKDQLNDTMKLRLRKVLAKIGLEVGTYAGSFAEHRLKLLESLGVRTVWDVGAHVGQYGSSLRANGYRGHIVSFEPASAAHADLQRTASGDERWTVVRAAAGQADDELELNISANGQSSSLLPMLTRHVAAAPRSAYIGTESVPVRPLDELVDELRLVAPFALKLDVQGYEMSALSGATQLLADCVLAEVELSLSPLYADGANWQQVVEYLSKRSLRLCDIDRVYYDHASGDLLQIDGLFRRDT